MLDVLSCRARRSGVLGDGWAEVMLAERLQISEYLAEEYEAVGRRGPHAEWPRSAFFNSHAMRVFDYCYAGTEGSTILCAS